MARDSLNEIENWRSKIKKKSVDENKTKPVKPNYLKPCADWDLITSHKIRRPNFEKWQFMQCHDNR